MEIPQHQHRLCQRTLTISEENPKWKASRWIQNSSKGRKFGKDETVWSEWEWIRGALYANEIHSHLLHADGFWGGNIATMPRERSRREKFECKCDGTEGKKM